MTAAGHQATATDAGFRAEDLFLAWLFHLPEGADIGAAAQREMARLDREGGVSDGQRYRAFLAQAIAVPQGRRQRRRLHH